MKAPTERSIVKVELSVPTVGYGTSLVDFMEALDTAMADVPDEFQDKVECHIHSWTEYDTPMAEFEAWYWRPETDEEWTERVARFNQQYAEMEAEERSQLARLQAKYGSARQG